jgi:hypothetical protein
LGKDTFFFLSQGTLLFLVFSVSPTSDLCLMGSAETGNMKAQDHFTTQHYSSGHHYGPVGFLNPTTRLSSLRRSKSQDGGIASSGGFPTALEDATGEPGSHHQAYAVWRSRDNRKGRHAVAVTSKYHIDTKASAPAATNTLKETLQGVAKMFCRYPVWDISYDVAVMYTLGLFADNRKHWRTIEYSLIVLKDRLYGALMAASSGCL